MTFISLRRRAQLAPSGPQETVVTSLSACGRAGAPSAVSESRLYEASLALFSDHVINYELNVELKSLELRLSLVPYR